VKMLELFFYRYIGINAAGDSEIANGSGIFITVNASNNYVGTSGAMRDVERNVISGNDGNGITVEGTRNFVAGNFIGTDATGSFGIGNAVGVYVRVGTSNVVGISDNGIADPKEGNVISGNDFNGIVVESTNGTVIAGNIVGLDAQGNTAVPNGNRGIGILGNTTTNTRIGSNGNGISDTLERNVISGNLNDGIISNGGDNTAVRCNLIGVSADGTVPLPNGGDGIQLAQGADGNYLLRNNLIAHNPVGVRFASNTVSLAFFNNRIKGNGTGFLNKSASTVMSG
ncbi:MAG: hypothetical protein JW953_14585, partial [Anaerolineae bacterium]|nr:hypothetical protein [Anaerolineae bacterium]